MNMRTHRLAPLAIIPALLALPTALPAQTAGETPPRHGGDIGVVQQGLYVCELPDPRAPSRGVVQDGAGFRILDASRYISDEGTGTYLRRGDRMILSSGPRRGESYHIVTPGFFRKLEGGSPGRLRCIRRGR
ncbi:hypothetical protein V5740_05210 [Croceibacterium sp. TMG7-5b_MA50]|uniref:hypothetical protein n=1 Tax=Croceibacterium sp. TMG7-5b_MA50 TaxID=3121290 RepID=UPI0032215AC5